MKRAFRVEVQFKGGQPWLPVVGRHWPTSYAANDYGLSLWDVIAAYRVIECLPSVAARVFP